MLGITFSPTEDLRKWREEVGLTADLLCDADRSVALAYGAAESADQERATRVTVIVGPDGKVLQAYAVDNAEAHPAEALAHNLVINGIKLRETDRACVLCPLVSVCTASMGGCGRDRWGARDRLEGRGGAGGRRGREERTQSRRQ